MSNLSKLLELCEELNADDFTVNMNFAGHINSFTVDVTTGKEENCKECGSHHRPNKEYIPLLDYVASTPIEESTNKLTALHEEWRSEHPLQEAKDA